ncbi:MAG: hypothetical protein NDI61_10185, partial [Bdellovibrionaceae bacterium]|nr:hypothetical protein [Pseudobdellovibrionaceae bacterium]
TSACSAWIPVHLRATWSSTAENSFNLRLLNVHATKYIRNPAPPTGTAPVVSFGFGLGTQILTTEGANFNYQLRLNTPVSEAVSVEVCRSAGFAGSPSLIGSLTSAGQYTLTPEQFDSGAGYDCNTHVIPRGSTTVTVTETVYDDNMTTNENTSAFIYLLWIQGSRQAEIGINNVFNVYVRDNDTYLELLSITDVGDSYDITYRHNLTFCARLKVEPNPPWLMSSLCAIAPSTLSMICFEPTGTVPVTGRVHKTCLSPYANSGTRVYLVPGNTEALSESNRMPLP